MPVISDQDRFFSGKLRASLPKHIIEEGSISRLYNGRFVEGAITNAVGFSELEVSPVNDKLIPNTNVYYSDILSRGDVQLLAPLSNIAGDFLIAVISGILFSIDLETLQATDITPIDAYLQEKSLVTYPLSYLDNDGGTYGSGGYLVIFNYPNRPIFINQEGARISKDTTNPVNYETPTSRLGVTGGNRAFVFSGNSLMYASDPLGGSSSLAPLTYNETLDPAGAFTGQVFTIGSSLDNEIVTAACRFPKLFANAVDFLGQNILVSTKRKKYIIAVGNPRDDWESIPFISYGGSSEGIAGSLACTNIGSNVAYISNTGRIKLYAQDVEVENSLSESYFDEDLGQYLNPNESNYYFRTWYRELLHKYSVIKFNNGRLYATVYPYEADAINVYNQKTGTVSHRALAVGSLSPETTMGPQATITWEGFYDWFNPVSIATLGTDTYVATKTKEGKIQFFKEDFQTRDDHKTTIVTRGYFGNVASKSKSILDVYLYFRKLSGKVKVTTYYLIEDSWIKIGSCESSDKLMRFSMRQSRCKTDSWSIPIMVEIEHKGCHFELESIRVSGETHKEEK